MLVTYPPGASVDFTARPLAQRMGDALGQAVVVDNRGGTGGVIAAELAARAAADGYTLFFATPASLCVSPVVQRKVAYDTLRDFAPISRLVVNSQIMVALILLSQGSDPRPSSADDFAAFIRSDCPNWARAVKLAGIKPE